MEGLTTRQALHKLELVIEDQLSIGSLNERGRWWSLIRLLNTSLVPYSIFGFALSLLVLLSTFLNIVFYKTQSDFSLVGECVFLLFCILFNMGFFLWNSYLKNNESQNAVLSLLQSVRDEKVSMWESNDYPDPSLPECRTVSMVWVYRDGSVVSLPWNLLVEEDVIVLEVGGVVPAHCRQVVSLHTENALPSLQPGDTFNPTSCKSVPCRRERFVVTQAPLQEVIRTFLYDNHAKTASKYDVIVKRVTQVLQTRVALIIYIVSALSNTLRWFFFPQHSGLFLEMLLLVPAYTVLPLLPLVVPFMWIMVTFYGMSKIKALLKTNQKPPSSYQQQANHLKSMDWRSVFRIFSDILQGDSKGLPRSVNFLHMLASITVFCCVDKEGVLCYPQQVPEKVFFFKDQLVKEAENKEEKQENTQDVLFHDVEILNMSPDPQDKHFMQFDDLNWKENVSSLKPLGLNMLLNCPYLSPLRTKRNNDVIKQISLLSNNRHHIYNLKRGCLCQLARNIGFKDEVLENFQTNQQLFCYRHVEEPHPPSNVSPDKHVPHMQSCVVTQTNRDCMQMLTVGSADVVLEACSDVWNGKRLHELTSVERKKALCFFQRMNITGTCLAYSYRPVFEVDNDSDDVFVELKEEIGNSKEKIEWKSFAKIDQLTRSDLNCEDLLNGHTETKNDDSLSNLQQQIFLGMVTMNHLLKEDVVSLIEQLNGAGVRFVHFSYDNELLSRVFCERLGLETGWNCHISLKDGDECSSLAPSDTNILFNADDEHAPDNEEGLPALDFDYSNNYEDFSELYFMSNRSKLPKGIRHMRSHLEEVDDVPLLVPLFTDCSPAAVCEMISIMQDYNEIVCCIGSSLNSQNRDMFAFSDISISVKPISQRLCNWKNDRLQESKGPMVLSSLINSLNSSLTFSREVDFPIAPLICEARRLISALQSCCLFWLSCSLHLCTLQLFSSFLLLPPLLNGCHTLWLTCFIVPLLSISLIAKPNDAKLMNVITGKRKLFSCKELYSAFASQFIFTFGLLAGVTACVLYPWLLNVSCNLKRTPEQCDWLLANRSVPSYTWNDDDHVTREIILFYTTLLFVTSSANFVQSHASIWQQPPFYNRTWLCACLLSIVVQCIYTGVSIHLYHGDNMLISSVPIFFWLTCCASLPIAMAINELFKRSSIRHYVRFQKRERLKFNTKLGMNSPI